jgi:hypothetical protein
MTRICLIVFALVVAGCRPEAPSSNDAALNDSGQTYLREVSIKSRQRPISVLFGESGALICEGKIETAREIISRLASSVPYDGGYSYLDVTNEQTSYRAYFKMSDMRSNSDATYVFCSEAGSSLSGAGCVLTGVFSNGCFETYVSDASTIDQFDSAATEVRHLKKRGRK